MPVFEFSYMTNKNEVNIDDLMVSTKTGPFLKRNFATSNLLYFRYTQEKTYHSLIMVYMDDKGKKKKMSLMATPGEPGIQNLNYYLMEKFPQKGLNHLSEKDAFATMQVTNPKKAALWVILIILNLILGITLYPELRHFFDFGFANVNIEDVISGKDIGTRNINVKGMLLSYGIEETTTHSKAGVTTSTSHTTFVPIVPDNWQEGDPIKALIKFDEMSDSQYETALDLHEFLGVIRNVGWEGVTDKQLSYFDEQYNITFPEKPLLIEYTNSEHTGVVGIAVLGGVNMIILLIIFFQWMKNRK